MPFESRRQPITLGKTRRQMILVIVIPAAHFAVMIVVRVLLATVFVVVAALVIAFVVSVPVAVSLGLRKSWTACK